jgi:membrane-bound ClpP family serine protease
MRAILAVLVFLIANMAALAFAAGGMAAQTRGPEVLVGSLDGIINPVMAAYAARVIGQAESDHAAAVVFSVNSPGGLGDATRSIDQRIEQSSVPVILWVDPSGAHTTAPLTGRASYVAPDLQEVLQQADGSTVQVSTGPVTLRTANAAVQPADMTAFESFLFAVSNPTIAYILLSMGCLGLLLELYNPGSVVPGVVGGTCLLLGLYGLGSLPLNLTGVALLGFGLLLFALEPFLTAHGILAVGGAIAFALGSLMLINAPDAPFLAVSRVAIAGVTSVLFGFFLVLVTTAIRSRRGRAVTGREGLFGASGVVRREIEPGRQGLVLVHGELWKAIATGGRLRAGEDVVVQSVEGLLLTVRRAAATMPAPPRPASPAMAKSGSPRG